MTIDQLLHATPFLPSELRDISAARAKVADLAAIHRKTARNRFQDGGERSWLHWESDRLAHVFRESPTHANAEAFHHAIVRCQQADISGQAIADILHECHQAESLALAPIMQALFARAGEKLEAEAEATRKALEGPNQLALTGSELQEFEKRVASLRQGLADGLQWAVRDPLLFMDQRGLALEAEAPAGPTAKPRK